MRLVEFLKNNLFLQNLASWIFSMIPPMVEHNIQKYGALKKAFYLTALEQLDGDYLEFGVFTGSSFVFATRIHQKLKPLGKINTRFFGFDSFEGFGKQANEDCHPFYKDDIFCVNAERIISNIKRKSKNCYVEIIKGYFDQTLKNQSATSLGITKSRIVFIDCDLKEPSQLALEFVRPTLQNGTILIMDDYYSYRGNINLGVSGAFEAFKAKYPTIQWRRLYDYGYGGIAYIVSQPSD